MITPETEEDARQKRFLEMPQGEPGSGAMRYAAAMYFFQRGMMSERELEFYRAHTKIDGVSPVTKLVLEAERYIGALEFAGKGEVMRGIAHWSQGPLETLAQKQVSTLSHLDAALAAMRDKPLASAIKEAAPVLRWVTYSYEGQDIGETFPANHAFASLIGEYGPYKAHDFDLGLFLIAPRVFYRDHYHQAPELYAPLTGPHGWRFNPGGALVWRAADVPVWNAAFQHHATLVGDVPFLALFAWTKDVNTPARVIQSPDWVEIELQGGTSNVADMPPT